MTMAPRNGIGLTLGSLAALGLLYFAACDPEPAEELSVRSLAGNEHPTDPVAMFVFELDGNAIHGPSTDWDQVFPGPSPIEFRATAFIAEVGQATVFNGGGSKDTSNISEWRYKDGSAPDKDNIENAFAAAYITEDNPLTAEDESGQLVVYFGADRYGNSGDALLGFWFFQQDVSLGANGRFTGVHEVGDVLVLANFANGGSVANIEVLEWVASGGNVSPNLRRLFNDTANCDSDTVTTACAISNSGGVPAPWAYTPKSGTPNVFPKYSFFEGGINITKLFDAMGQEQPCFATFMAETRASTSPTATLKDFVLGSFPVCGVGIAGECTDDGHINENQNGFVYPFSGTITNNGYGTITNIEVLVDDKAVAIQPPVTSLDPGESHEFTASFGSTENPASATLTVKADPDLEASTELSVNCVVDRDPMINVTVTCDRSLRSEGGKLVAVLTYGGDVCNTSEGVNAVGLTGVTVTDGQEVYPIGDLAPGQCKEYASGFIYPSSTDQLDDVITVTAEGQAALGGGEATDMDDAASCLLCPI